MSTGNEFEQFRKTFFEECQEILSDLDGLLGTLAVDPSDRECLNAIFRGVHSIKAGAGAFSFTRLVGFSHTLEAALDGLRDGRIAGTDQVTQLLVRAVDTLAAFVEAAQGGAEPQAGYGDDLASDLLRMVEASNGRSIAAAASVKPTVATPAAQEISFYRIRFKPHWEMFRHANEPLLVLRELGQLGTCTTTCDMSRLPAFNALDPEDSYLSWTIEIETSAGRNRLAEVFEFVEDDCELTIEELGGIASMPASEEPENMPASPVDEPIAAGGNIRANGGDEAAKGRGNNVSSIRVELARVDRLVNMVGELVITQSMLAQQIADLALAQGSQAVRGQEDLAMLTRELQECVMAIRMQPVKSVFARMPRLVREVSGKLGKPIRLAMSGELTEVDKTVIEELADPLTHMIRNAIDHGIESPDARRAAGKPEEGTIELTALHAGSNILIHVADDGGGIDRERLFRKAVE